MSRNSFLDLFGTKFAFNHEGQSDSESSAEIDDESEDSVIFEYDEDSLQRNSEQKSNPVEHIYRTIFVTHDLRNQVSLEQVIKIQGLLKTIAESLNKAENEIKELNSVINTLLENKTGTELALLSLSLQQCVCLLIREDEDFYTNLKTYNQFIKKLLPKITALICYEFYHVEDHYGVVEICDPRTKNPVAYYKAGHHQQQGSQFLYEFYQQLAAKMDLPKDVEYAFPPCQPFDVCMNTIKFRSDIKLTSEDIITFMVRHNEKFYFSDMFLEENVKRQAWLSGGIMPPIPSLSNWEMRLKKHDRTSLHMLIKLCFILMLGGRDVKSDGLGGTLSEIFFDMEDYLNKKQNKTNLHIPYIEDINNAEISKKDLEDMLSYLNKIDVKAFAQEVIKPWIYDDAHNFNDFDTVNDDEDYGACIVEIDKDMRMEYLDKNPKFHKGCILSEAQIENFIEYFGKLKIALERMIEEYAVRAAKGENTVYFFLETFDKDWAQDELQWRRVCSEELLSSRSPSPKDSNSIQRLSLARSQDSLLGSSIQNGRKPTEFNGSNDRPIPMPLTLDQKDFYARTPTPSPFSSLSSSMNEPPSPLTQNLITSPFCFHANNQLRKMSTSSQSSESENQESFTK